MSYIVLARKWRPQNFDGLVGQETVVTTLKNALSSGKIVHAYLFSGPRGVGKTTSARLLAKALNCEQRKDAEPCNVCQSCTSITSGSSVDVIEIDGASNNRVEEIRELRETVKYAPSGGKYKIYIIDEVHMVTMQAFNALLKTLEEPPPHVVFIFATTEPKKVPITILSRCQHHSFRRVSRGRIKEQLSKIKDAENITITDAALEMIAKAADGSMRDALTLLDQACSFSSDINEDALQSLLGLPETELISSLAETILRGDMAQTLTIIKDLSDRGSDLRQITKEIVEYFRNLAVIKITRNAPDLLEFTEEEAQRMSASASEHSIEELTLLLTELLRLDGEVRSAVNPRYTLELGLLRTSFVKGMTSIGDIMKLLSGTEPAVPPAPSKAPVKAPSPITPAVKEKESSPLDVSPGQKTEAGPEKKTELIQQLDSDMRSVVADREGIWNRLLEQLDARDHLLACKLAEARLVNLTDSEMTIGFNGGLTVLSDSIRKNAPVIEQILQTLSGQKIRLMLTSLPKTETRKDVSRIKQEVFAEPIVQDAMKIFNSSLVNVKPLESGEAGEGNEKQEA